MRIIVARTRPVHRPFTREEPSVLECVVNVSEGRRPGVVASLADAVRGDLLDVHTDPDHNRSVLTLVGEDAPRALARAAVAAVDLREHDGVHPRLGAVDVVPFVPLAGATDADARAARDRFARWVADELGVPAFLYGPERTLPEVRREAFRTLVPDAGPPQPHPSAGAVAVGARPVLVAWNVWLAEPDLALAKRVASAVRGPHLRALGLAVAGGAQVSMNLVAPDVVGPAEAWDRVAALAAVDRAELVGLVPASTLERIDPSRWGRLDLAEERTIEHRLAARAAAARG
jgi:glutamate formiminotransferase/glutamate formiminotransferase/formiminotetrahydrofolate cyclodeaminase